MMKQDVTQAAQEALGFLVSEKGFVGPECDDQRYWTKLKYTYGNIGIEAELDWHECWAFLLLVRLQNGVWPKGYVGYFKDGKACRVHLETLIRHCSWPVNFPLPGGAHPASFQQMITELRTDAEMLREVIDRILEMDVAVFEQVRMNPGR